MIKIYIWQGLLVSTVTCNSTHIWNTELWRKINWKSSQCSVYLSPVSTYTVSTLIVFFASSQPYCKMNSPTNVPVTVAWDWQATLIKKKINFPHISGHSDGSGAKSYMINDLVIYGENICAFPHILGSLSSYMTLHPISS